MVVVVFLDRVDDVNHVDWLSWTCCVVLAILIPFCILLLFLSRRTCTAFAVCSGIQHESFACEAQEKHSQISCTKERP